MKKIVIFLLVIAMMSSLVGCGTTESKGSSSEASTSKEVKEITVVGTGSFYPVIYTDEKGNLTGFEHDVIEEIAARAGYTVKWKLSDDYTAMFAGLDSGIYDTIAAQISVTEKREKTYTFTDKYAANEIKMCVRGDDEAKVLEDLQGRKVCIEFGTTLHDFFDTYNAELDADKQIECVVTAGSPYEELASKHFDSFPITVLSFDAVTKKGEYDFKLIGDPIIIDYQAFPFAKDADPEMIEAFNIAIKEMREDGTLSDLSMKYYNRDVTDVAID